MPTDKRIAIEIFKQLGGGHFKAMVGAHQLVALPDGLQLKFKGSRKANCLVVKLNGLDLYDLELWKITKKFNKKMDQGSNIYFDGLQDWFTNATGLNTHL